jgi:hypothetical protein
MRGRWKKERKSGGRRGEEWTRTVCELRDENAAKVRVEESRDIA